jgi:drug/metabolite transporter (DMT)-like permease
MRNTISQKRITALAIISCLLWSSAFVVIKLGLEHTKPFSFAGIRFMLAGILLVPFWLGKVSRSDFTKRSLLVILKVAMMQTFILYALFYYAITMVSGAVTSIIVGVSPIASTIVPHFVTHDDKLNKTKIYCMSIALTGVVLVVLGTKPWAVGGLSELLGIMLLLAGAVVSAFANIIVSEDKKSINPVFLNSIQIFLGGVMLFVISIPLEGIPKVSGLSWFFYSILAWLAFLSATAFSLWFYLLQHDNVKVSELNFWKFLIPVFGATLSWIILPGESPNIMTLGGMFFIAFAVYRINKGKDLIV